jgi:hypothetical protein
MRQSSSATTICRPVNRLFGGSRDERQLYPVKPGMFDKYVKWLATDCKRNMEAQKTEGIILDYAVYSSPQSREGDWNMVLTTTYKNMAALDSLRDRAEPVANRTLNTTPEQRAQEAIEREAMRDQLGSRLLRRLQLR